jgi:hypothetical protein
VAVQILPVSSKADMEDFLRLPFAIYRDDPHWVPPVLSYQRKFLDPAHGPFFEIGQAQYFLAKDQGRVVGRISAHLNFAYEKHHDTDTGFFGFFECEDSPQAAAALFDAAGQWAKLRGKTKLHGPLSFGIYDEVGLLVEGYHQRPIMMHTYNPPYYEELITGYGFKKSFDWYAYAFRPHNIKPVAPQLRQRLADILAEQKVVIQQGNPKEFIKRSREVMEMFNTLWSKNWGHVPLTEAQFQDFFMQLRPIVRPDLINFIIERDELLAFNIQVPDINITLHKTRGKLGPLGILRLLYDSRVAPLRGARAVIMGVKKSHQWRRLHHALILNSILTFLDHHPKIEYCDASLIPESLTRWNKTLIMFGAERNRTFRLYDKAL